VPAPLYQELRDDLDRQIRSGALPPGAQLPTEAQLQKAHGVSRGTAQRALDELARAGMVLRRRGFGTVVVDQTRQENLLRFTDPLISTHALPGRHVVLSAAVVAASEVPFEMPGVLSAEPVIFLARQKLDEHDTPMGMEWSAIPFTLAPQLMNQALPTLHLFKYYVQQGLPVDKTRLYLDPVVVDDETATLIGCEPGIPALRRRRYVWLTDGSLLEAGIYFTRPDLMALYVEQSLRLQ